MVNKIVTDSSFNIELLVWLQEPRTYDNSWTNSIVIHIDADATVSQYLHVNGGDAGTHDYTVTPSSEQDIEIEDTYWNMGGDTVITLNKGGTPSDAITITFPDQIDSLGMLNQDEEDDRHFIMTGSYNDPSDIAEDVENFKEETELKFNDVDDQLDNKENKIEAGATLPQRGVRTDMYVLLGSVGNPDEIYQHDGQSWYLVKAFPLLEGDPLKKIEASTIDIGEGVQMEAGSMYLVYD